MLSVKLQSDCTELGGGKVMPLYHHITQCLPNHLEIIFFEKST